MAVTKAKKVEIIGELTGLLKNAASVTFVATNKLTVLEITTIRRDLRAVGGTFVMAKKTLIRHAFREVLGVELDISTLPGQVTMLVASQDAIAPIGIVNRYAKERDFAKEEKLKFVGGYMEGRVLDAAEATKLASLPSRETLLAKLLGSMKAPVSAMARFLDAAKTKMEETNTKTVAGLASLAEKKEEAPAPAAAEPVVEAAPEAPAAAAEEAPAEETKAE